MTFKRIQGSAVGRARAVQSAGIVYAVATAQDSSPSVAVQTKLTLAALEKNLEDAGSDKTRILQATVYLRNMDTKLEMDEVWCDWIGAQGNWPQRACVGVDLAGDDLVEIVVIATVNSG